MAIPFQIKCEVKLSHDLEIPQLQVELKNNLQIIRKTNIILQILKYFNFVMLTHKKWYWISSRSGGCQFIFIFNFISYLQLRTQIFARTLAFQHNLIRFGRSVVVAHFVFSSIRCPMNNDRDSMPSKMFL